jgi:hypothetical protein
MAKGLFEPCPESMSVCASSIPPRARQLRLHSKASTLVVGGAVTGRRSPFGHSYFPMQKPSGGPSHTAPPQGCIQDALVTEHMWIPVALGGMHGTDQAVEPSRRHSTKTKWRSRLLRKHAPLEEAGGGAADMYSFVPGTMLSLTSSSRLQGRTKACSDRMTENGA